MRRAIRLAIVLRSCLAILFSSALISFETLELTTTSLWFCITRRLSTKANCLSSVIFDLFCVSVLHLRTVPNDTDFNVWTGGDLL